MAIVAKPELDKMMHVVETSQKIGEFLEWLLSTKHYVISEWTDVETLQPVGGSSYGLIESLLAEYYQIDLKKVESEKQAILSEFQKHAST